MGHKNHYSPSSEIAHIIAEVRRMNAEQIADTYGIEIRSNGTVYDTAYDQEFKNIQEWAAFTVNQDSSSDYEDQYDKYNDRYDEEDF